MYGFQICSNTKHLKSRKPACSDGKSKLTARLNVKIDVYTYDVDILYAKERPDVYDDLWRAFIQLLTRKCEIQHVIFPKISIEFKLKLTLILCI